MVRLGLALCIANFAIICLETKGALIFLDDKKTEYEQVLAKLDRLQTEVRYNRIVMAIFLIISLFYFNLKISGIGNALGTFIEMFMG